MQSFDVSEICQSKETDLKSGFTPDHNMGLPIDLLREGRNLSSDQLAQPANDFKASCPSLPEMTLSNVAPANTVEAENLELQKSWGDIAKWGKAFVNELEKVGLKIVHGIENIKPADLLELAQDIAVVAARFGPEIAADVTRVIKCKGMDPVSDAKLVYDLVRFAKSPEAAKLGKDTMKILREFQEKYGITE